MRTVRLRSILLGGIVITLVSVVPLLSVLNLFCCTGIILGGVVAVHYYRRHLPGDVGFDVARGLSMGLLSGLVAVVLAGVIVVVGYHAGYRPLENQSESIFQSFEMTGQDVPPEIVEFFGKFQGEGGARLLVVLHLIFNLVFFPTFGMVGGLIGALLPGARRADPGVTEYRAR